MGFLSGLANVLTGGLVGDIGSVIAGGQTRSAINNAQQDQLNAINNASGNVNTGLNQSTATLQGAQGQANTAQNQSLQGTLGANAGYLGLGQVGNAGLAGMAGNNGLQNPNFSFDPSQVTNSPVFAQTMQNAMKALQRSAAGRGNLFSGGTSQNLIDYAKQISESDYANEYARQFGLAQQKYNSGVQNAQDQYNRYLGLTNVGQQAAGRVGSAYQNYGNETQNAALGVGGQIANNQTGAYGNLANLALQGGNVNANSELARAGVWNNMINNITGSGGAVQSIGQLIGLGQARGGGGGFGQTDANGNVMGPGY